MFPAACFPKSNTRSSAGPVYVRTAFVSSTGNDGTAALNNDALPFLTHDAAVNALAAAYPGQETTLRYQTDLASVMNLSANLDTLLTAGLTMMSHDATVRTLSGAIYFGSAAGALLTLSKLTFSERIEKPANVGGVAVSAGTITGDADTTITLLILDGAAGVAGGNGANGGTVTGDNGANGADGDPPSPGISGGSASGDGIVGEQGGNGGFAWDVTLEGSGLISSVLGRGGAGGIGGNGGGAGSSTGGNGGAGGNSNAFEMQDGAPGGDGGNASANGGDGGVGGAGGNGSTVTKAAGWTITSSDLSAGFGGPESTAGSGGLATAGSGGNGGTGASGGSSGLNGNDGTASAMAGAQGSAGADGVAGSIM